MEFEDQKTLKPSNKRKTDSKQIKTTKHNSKTDKSFKNVQNSTTEIKEGNLSPNQQMDNRIQNSLEELGIELESKLE